MDFYTIWKDIGLRLKLENRCRNDPDHRKIVGEIQKYQESKTQLKTLVGRLHPFAPRFPDVWIRFCRMVPPSDLPKYAILQPIPVPTAAGPFPLSAELIQGQVLPFLSYPSMGRLARTCKWMRLCVGPTQLADAMERFRSRAYDRFTVQGDTVRLWTIDEQPIILHIVTSNLERAGLEFKGEFYLASSSRCYVHTRWPEFMHERPMDKEFQELFRHLIANEDITICAKTEHWYRRIILHLYAHGPVFLCEKHKVLKFTVEFLWSAWGPRN